ncbi:MAG: Ig-like domain-containing protein [Bacteroidota bacterium]
MRGPNRKPANLALTAAKNQAVEEWGNDRNSNFLADDLEKLFLALGLSSSEPRGPRLLFSFTTVFCATGEDPSIPEDAYLTQVIGYFEDGGTGEWWYRPPSRFPLNFVPKVKPKRCEDTTFPIDTDPPLIVEQFPADQASGVNVELGYIQYTFNKVIELGAGEISIYDADTNQVEKIYDVATSEDFEIRDGGFTLRILNPNLSANTRYEVRIDNGAIRSQAGIAFPGLGDEDHTFSTLSQGSYSNAYSPSYN